MMDDFNDMTGKDVGRAVVIKGAAMGVLDIVQTDVGAVDGGRHSDVPCEHPAINRMKGVHILAANFIAVFEMGCVCNGDKVQGHDESQYQGRNLFQISHF